MFDVVIVGGGPAGCRTAEIVAKKGYEVLVVEEHPEIGKPVQCTGLVSHRIGKIPKEIIVNKIKKARFYCKKSFFEVKSRRTVYVIDREKYDKFIAEKARKNGAKFKLNTRFLDFKYEKILTTNGIYKSKILVGADGPNSTVARKAGLELPKNLLLALQSTIYSEFDSDTVELWFGSDIAPNNFAWVVPENEEKARVGLMTERNPNMYFDRFLKMRFGRTVKKRIGDVIRYGLIKKSISDRVLLVGDAACMVKPFSGGGLVYGRIGAELTGKACVKALKENNFSEKFFLENYDKKWKDELRNPIKKGLIIKKVFSKFSDTELFFSLVKSFRLSKLSSFLDMDFIKG